AYVSLAAMQQALDVAGKVNTIFVGGHHTDGRDSLIDSVALGAMLQPKLTDYGLALKHVTMKFGQGDAAETIYDYFSLSSERMLIDPAAERVITRALNRTGAQPVLTYLANNIEKVREPG